MFLLGLIQYRIHYYLIGHAAFRITKKDAMTITGNQTFQYTHDIYLPPKPYEKDLTSV